MHNAIVTIKGKAAHKHIGRCAELIWYIDHMIGKLVPAVNFALEKTGCELEFNTYGMTSIRADDLLNVRVGVYQ